MKMSNKNTSNYDTTVSINAQVASLDITKFVSGYNPTLPTDKGAEGHHLSDRLEYLETLIEDLIDRVEALERKYDVD